MPAAPFRSRTAWRAARALAGPAAGRPVRRNDVRRDLPGDDGEHPLSLLEMLEAPPPREKPWGPYHSEVAAWDCLVVRFGHRTSAIAEFLLISPSWCRTRRRRASRRIEAQWPLPHGLQIDEDEHESALRPWRRFKLPPRPRPAGDQLPLDDWSHPAQPMVGQMWLL